MPKFISKVFGQLKSFGAKLLSGAQREFNIQVKVGKFDLSEKIELSEFNDGNKGMRKAADWVRKETKAGRIKPFKGIMESGKLYYFNYPNPKHRKKLAYWDAQPLVLCIGHYKSKVGDIIEVGINLHHLPPKVRKQVLVKVFDMYNRRYKGQMYRAKQAEVELEWKALAQPLLQYGAAFAIRSYIPKRRKKPVEFKYEDWDLAVYIPSEKLVGISQTKLEADWAKFWKNKSLQGLSADRLAAIIGSS